MRKVERCSSDNVTENNSIINFVQWKDNTLYGQSSINKAQRYIKEKHGRVDIEQPQSIYQYNQKMGRVDQNIIAYMIGHRSKKW